MHDQERNQLFEIVKMPEPTVTETVLGDSHSVFTLEPLVRGYGNTLGNSLRRVLLSSMPGAAAVAIRIGGVVHEFSTVEGVAEDVTEIVLNIKSIVARSFSPGVKTAILDATGPGCFTAGDLLCPEGLEIVNTGCPIATLSEGASLRMEIRFDRGVSYVSGPENKKRYPSLPVGTIYVDSVFSPVTRVAYSVESARVGDSIDFDRLTLDMQTDGSLAPKDAMLLASRLLIGHYELLSCAVGEGAESDFFVSAEETHPQQIMDRSIEELDLSVRSYNCLKRAGVNTISDLSRFSESEIAHVRNLGMKSLTEIHEKLRMLGMDFRQEET